MISASRSPLAVVFRRGPSQQVASVLWDRSTDQFKMGQWLKGRIYERRCDLSPSGKYMIYFAMNGKWRTKVTGAWTAISRPPYLKALDLFAKGDCWHGGGLFLSDRSYWLNDGIGHDELKRTTRLRQKLDPEWVQGLGEEFGECRGVYFRRLVRDGWAMEEHRDLNQLHGIVQFEKPLPGGWTLVKLAHSQVRPSEGKGVDWDEHQLWHRALQIQVKKPEWEWADLYQMSLVWAEGGCLFKANIRGNEGVGSPRLLQDFCGMKFEELEAPY